MIPRRARAFGLGGVALALVATSMPLAAQDNEEARIRKLEAEVRALQRKVFPGGDGRYFEPQITAPTTTSPAASSASSTTAVTDILARMDALESQIQRLTSQYEEGANAMRLLEGRIEALETTRAPSPSPIRTDTSSASNSTPEPVATPDPARVAAVQAIAKPQTDDAGDDEYSYGFRLWDAGFYPEAQQQLTMFVEEYPNHSRTSYGRNLLGRAYLDDGKPAEAAPWFLRNYQADKNGARAGDSLLFLAEAMITLKDTERACIALSEFGETYPALASGRLQGEYAAARSKVTCG